MPRGARILMRNVCYHIVNRGNQKQNIFLEDNDYIKFLEILKHYKRKCRFRLYGYCLMPNHIHMILWPKDPAGLAKFMQGILQTYSICFSKKYKKPGRIWQGRFKSMIVEKDNYFLDCIYYVEMNPVRAGLVSSPAQYRWSSYRERVFGDKTGLLDLPDST